MRQQPRRFLVLQSSTHNYYSRLVQVACLLPVHLNRAFVVSEDRVAYDFEDFRYSPIR